MLVVFDIDGTVADIQHRIHWIKNKPKNWVAFDAAAAHDKVIIPIRNVYLNMTYDGHNTILFVTGRNEKTRKQTEQWLQDNSFTGYTKLFMRKAADYRSDVIVKQEILNQIINEFGQKPDIVFEDRPRVIRMWRDNGIFVCSVAQDDEEF
jgi:phosphoserine phosphatase